MKKRKNILTRKDSIVVGCRVTKDEYNEIKLHYNNTSELLRELIKRELEKSKYSYIDTDSVRKDNL